ncbi:hypothetical protein HPP92_010133 [Vanilla planifolia]|uniref:Uncharacterized protein n=1 Tax=Vanilla planifolia TaxID=51239 RepID=A0A835V0I2_VANPL|nr:hypothetical protein HPP92_010133 [Vanilla planifolia]
MAIPSGRHRKGTILYNVDLREISVGYSRSGHGAIRHQPDLLNITKTKNCSSKIRPHEIAGRAQISAILLKEGINPSHTRGVRNSKNSSRPINLDNGRNNKKTKEPLKAALQLLSSPVHLSILDSTLFTIAQPAFPLLWQEHIPDLRMEKEAKSNNLRSLRGAPEADFLLQWGNRKRQRCVKVRSPAGGTPPARLEGQRRSTSRVNRRVVRSEKDLSSPPFPALRRSESAGSENAKPRSVSVSPEKEDRFYPTRGSVAAAGDDKAGGGGCGVGVGEDRMGATAATMLPRFFISLSNKEKEEDFMAMKGCKLPQRPKKRPKILQKSLLLVSPGAWLTDLSYERYEVREKRSSRKRRRGLKAMCLESESE